MRNSMSVLIAAAFAVGFAAPTLGQVINEDLKLLPNDGAAGDGFGGSIAIDNGVVAVGAAGDNYNGTQSGSAYVFDASTGAQIAKLLPSDGATSDFFSISIAVANGVVAVGAFRDDDNGADSGSAYLFDASTGAQLHKLLPSDGAAEDEFGRSIGIDNGIVAIGANEDDDNGSKSGSAYLFDASTGAQLHKLLPIDGRGSDEFGISIAIDNGIVAVGAFRDDDMGINSGSAYLFDASTGSQIAKLLPIDGAEFDEFGISIAIGNGVVAVGAHQDDDNGSFSGSVYVFDVSDPKNPIEIAKLLPSDGAPVDYFGISIAIGNGIVAVGANEDDDNGGNSGSAYLFDASTGTQIFKLLPSDGATDDNFGYYIGIDNGVVAVGAHGDDDNGSLSGSAYVFDVESNGDCLDLTVENLVAGKRAIFTIAYGTPGKRAVTVYGTRAGQTNVNSIAGYCATFGIKGVNQDKIIGGLNRTFDTNGEINFGLTIPNGTSGLSVFFQSAQKGTCPDECMSNLVGAVVG